MPFRHGKNAYFRLDNSGGTLQNLSPYLNEVGFPRTIETGETTSFGNQAKTYVVGLSDATISLSGTWDAPLDAILAGVLGQDASLTFEYGPEGSTAGFVRYTGECYLTSYETSSPVADVVTFSAELQVTGTVTRNTF